MQVILFGDCVLESQIVFYRNKLLKAQCISNNFSWSWVIKL